MKISAWQSLRKAGCTDRTFILKSNSPVRLFTDLEAWCFHSVRLSGETMIPASSVSPDAGFFLYLMV
ncbi:hypothetical protein NXW46_10110 [Bacteroides fragilis]|nr:hypothetical protein [Bacteroides fragilis]UVR31436.1 hypothetical protein NXW46_10110 [Bacteroides fragilis]